jgi:LacI family transcriptional regulator
MPKVDAGGRKPFSSRATMQDVAALAGVSAKTVSRVVNGEHGVSEAVLTRVTEAINRLQYRHNLAASQLRSGPGTATAIGLLLVDIGNPFSSLLHRVIEDTARERGFVILAASTDEDTGRERAAVNAFTARRVDGLIMMPSSHDQSYLLPELAAGTKIVMIDRPPSFLDVDAVVSDNRSGSLMGTEHLISQGHRRIGYLGDLPGILSSKDRFEGYREALTRAGITYDPSIVRQGFTDGGEITQTVRLMLQLDDAPTAFFVGQNLICAPTLRALKELGLSRSVAVVGFDGFEAADLVEPGMTVVTQSSVEMGRRAAEVMFSRLDGASEPARIHVLPTTLITRGSGEIPGPGGTSERRPRR